MSVSTGSKQGAMYRTMIEVGCLKTFNNHFYFKIKNKEVIGSGFTKKRLPSKLSSNFAKSVNSLVKSYFKGEKVDLGFIPTSQNCTTFQNLVFKKLKDIPYSQTTTYAKLLNNPKFARAIGQALSKNNIPVFIPCHRVVSKKGLGGFSSGLKLKKSLLDLENNQHKI